MNPARASAVVFAYHNVGVRGLSALLDLGVEVPLVVTHEDSPRENIWFASVAQLAAWQGIPVIQPRQVNQPQVIRRLRECSPDFLFSFYYRQMLGDEILAIPSGGGYNLHGSLLPKYRGRVPVNWAILHGEAETGASLHRMETKPDAGDLVDQQAVAILRNDTANDVMQKVTCAAECVILRSVPRLLDGSAVLRPLNLSSGSYFGGRSPEDGRIDWTRPAWEVHNLIRAVAPPYPGAFFEHRQRRIQVLGSYYRQDRAKASGPRLYWAAGRCYADCVDGERLCLTRLAADGIVLDESRFREVFGSSEQDLPTTFDNIHIGKK